MTSIPTTILGELKKRAMVEGAPSGEEWHWSSGEFRDGRIVGLEPPPAADDDTGSAARLVAPHIWTVTLQSGEAYAVGVDDDVGVVGYAPLSWT